MKIDSICVIRLSALGDVCLFLPTLNAIKRAYPNAKIVWIVGKIEAKLIDGIGGVEIIVYDKSSGLKGMFELGRKLKNRRFDYLLMAQEALRASVLSLFIRADRRVGFDRDRAKDFQSLFCNAQIAPNPRCHMIENYLDFARFLSADTSTIEYNLIIPREAFNEASAIAGGKNYCVLSPIANAVRRNWRNWTAEGYAAAIDYAYEKHGLTTIVTGANDLINREMADAIARAAKRKPIDAVGKTSIKTLLALIKNARFVIAPDSGPGHFAAALNVPAIALLAAADPRRAAPYQTPSFAVDRYREALLKYSGQTPETVKFGRRVRNPKAMSEITTCDVTAMIDKVMKKQNADLVQKTD
ncbi:MAG: glycosyltransferase family 9 protein [Helicobacteraceae bacterium]|nr:glycosyltransferase family 9 protein [Helicobacteraceae bacterium]